LSDNLILICGLNPFSKEASAQVRSPDLRRPKKTANYEKPRYEFRSIWRKRDEASFRSEQKYVLLTCCILLVACLLQCRLHPSAKAISNVTGELTTRPEPWIPGVKLTLTDQKQGIRIQYDLRQRRQLSLPVYPPGAYSVTAEMAGFEKSVRTGIRVDVNQNVTANISLKLSSSSQTVEVNAQKQVARCAGRNHRPGHR